MSRNSGALVVGFRRGDRRRFHREVGMSTVRTSRGPLVLPRRSVDLPTEYQCNRNAGPCISCGRDVYLNFMGWSALVEKDADVVCADCEDRYSADITRSL